VARLGAHGDGMCWEAEMGALAVTIKEVLAGT
jgi:hypothetical protein